MPRLNDCLITGFVADNPSIKKNAEGTIVQAAVDVIVCEGTHSYSESMLTGDTERRNVHNLHFDNIWISTKDPVFINKIIKLRSFDIIQCKGVVRVSQVRRKAKCTECGDEKKFFATKTAVYPIYLERLRSLTEEHGIKSLGSGIDDATEREIFCDGKAFLKNCVEISDSVTVIGAIAKQPELYRDMEKDSIMLSFPLAVKRSYFVPEDDMSVKTDFPYVKMYGKEAEHAWDMLSAGNLILVRGYLTSRKIFRKIRCDSCGEVIQVQDFITEIVPRSIEYIREDVRRPPVFGKAKALPANYIGSEAEIDLRKMGMNTAEEAVAAGVRPDSDILAVADAVSDTEKADIIYGEESN